MVIDDAIKTMQSKITAASAGAQMKVVKMSDEEARITVLAPAGDLQAIKDATFMTDGHESAIACGSMLTTLVRGRSMEAADKISPEELMEALGGLPEAKHHCAKLTVNTLLEAVADRRAGERASGQATEKTEG